MPRRSRSRPRRGEAGRVKAGQIEVRRARRSRIRPRRVDRIRLRRADRGRGEQIEAEEGSKELRWVLMRPWGTEEALMSRLTEQKCQILSGNRLGLDKAERI